MKTCPHCHKDLEAKVPDALSVEASVDLNATQLLEEDLISKVSKEAIKQVLQHIQPLLEKLSEAHPDNPNQVVGSMPVSADQNKQQLEQIQQAAQERIKKQEQQLASKLQKLQARFNKR